MFIFFRTLLANFFWVTLQGYQVAIYDLHGVPVEKLQHAIVFAYDKVNSRVSVTALFPEPTCLRAVISYRDQQLPNGDFDIIVLSSKCGDLYRLFTGSK